MPGFPELIVILIILFIIFGATNMPLWGEKLGQFLADKKKAKEKEDKEKH